MKKKLLLCSIIALIVLVAFFSGGIVAADRYPPNDTYHWLLRSGDDAHILCADCRFDIEVLGDDSIHLVPIGN